MDSCFRRNGTGEFLFSQEWRCRHGFLFRAEIASGDSADPGCLSGVFCVIECYVTIPAQAGIQYVEVPAWIPACAGMVRGNSCFRRSGGAGMDSCSGQRSRPVTARIQAACQGFSASLNAMLPFLRKQESSMWRCRHGFLLSQEWYGGIPVFAGVEVPAWIPVQGRDRVR